jgi:hypothetical protein
VGFDLEHRTSNIERVLLVFDNFIRRGKKAKSAEGERTLDKGVLDTRARAKDTAGQANKGTWWMPRHQPATKDADSCEKPRGAAKQALIRGCPNGETRPG